eukprot:scaffold16710_cov61-Attheya_sp.AAC.1
MDHFPWSVPLSSQSFLVSFLAHFPFASLRVPALFLRMRLANLPHHRTITEALPHHRGHCHITDAYVFY